jgi:hypothetical protein
MKVKQLPTQVITRTALLLALTLAIQAFRLQPVMTGPLVNFMLILSTLLVGKAGGIFIGSVTPWIALATGILPTPLAPAVPFIMLGNALLCLVTGMAIKGSTYLRVTTIVIGSILKFFVIAGAATYVLSLPATLTQVLTFPQLTNAIIGGLLAISTWQAIYKVMTAEQSYFR